MSTCQDMENELNLHKEMIQKENGTRNYKKICMRLILFFEDLFKHYSMMALYVVDQEDYKRVKTSEFMNIIHDELLAVTWHHSRLPWLIDHEQREAWGL
jgi:hypothetical protein